MTWIMTASGKRIDLIDPRPSQIDFNDMALALSRICRFNGHTPVFYSVLQHSLEVGKLFDPDDLVRKYALLHDCHEAITGDITTPVKQILNESCPALAYLQERLDCAIFQAAGLLYPMPESAKRRVFAADVAVLRRELIDVIGVDPKTYEIPDLQEFPGQARIVVAQDVGKLAAEWLQAIELPLAV